MRKALAVLVLLTMASGREPARAQELSLAGVGVHARYAGSVSGTAGGLSVRIADRSASAALGIDATLSTFTTGETAFSGSVRTGRMLLESESGGLGLTGLASYAGVEGAPWTGAAAAGLVGAETLGRALVSLALTGGGARDVTGTTFGTGSASLDFSTAGSRPTALRGGLALTAADTLRYADFTVGLLHRGGVVDFGVNLGARVGDLAGDPWGSAQLSARISAAVKLQVGSGWYPQDHLGFNEGFFFSVAVRVFPSARLRPPHLPPAPRNPFRVIRDNPDLVSIVVEQPGAAVEILGEFNGWEPSAMQRDADGTWRATLRLAPGVYEFALLVDGEWLIPEGIPTVDDGFGGSTGLLVVP